MPIRLDISKPPVVVVTFLGASSDQQLEVYLEDVSIRLREGRREIYIFDTRAMAMPPATHIKRQGEWLRDHRAAIQECAPGNAFVIASAATRFILSTIFLIQKPPVPYLVTESMDEALRWCQALATKTAMNPLPQRAVSGNGS